MKTTDSWSRKKLLDRWSYIIIISNVIHVEIAIKALSGQNLELSNQTYVMGVASLLACISLNTYLVTNKDYAYLPGTINFSSVDVFNGLIGVFPFMFGLAIFATCVLNHHFRFKDVWNSFMTMFYIMNGDTMFDTITGIRQVSFIFTMIWAYFWVWLGNNIIINITLAQVEHGYVQQKAFNKNDWLLKPIKDPEYEDHATHQA